jgi:hypothetical protein
MALTDYDSLIQAGGMAGAIVIGVAKYIAPLFEKWVIRQSEHMDRSDETLKEVCETLVSVDGTLRAVNDDVRDIQRRIEESGLVIRDVHQKCTGTTPHAIPHATEHRNGGTIQQGTHS